MQGRFEIRLAEGERGDLRQCAGRSGLSEAAVVRFGLRWAINRLDVLASGGTVQTGRSIAAFLDEMESDPRYARAAGFIATAIAELDREADSNRNAAMLHDMIGLVVVEPMPLVEKIRLLGDLLAFEGQLTIRRRTESAVAIPCALLANRAQPKTGPTP
jgi:hypothetical protein